MLSRQFSTRTILGMLLSFFVFVQIVAVGTLAAPRKVLAVVPVHDVVANPLNITKTVTDKISATIWDGLVGAVLTGATFFAQRVAYDSAIALANAGSGKTPAFQNKDFGTYLQDVGNDAMGETLNKLAKNWVGLDLCQPIDIRARLAIQIGLRQAFEQPLAKCSWDKIGENWEKQWDTLKEQYGGCSGGATGAAGAAARGGRTASGSVEDCMLAVARDVFKPSNTELGISVEANVKIQDTVRRKELASTKEREEGGGFKPIKDIITGNVKTPSKAVEEESKKLSSTKQEDRSFQLISGTMASGAKGALIGTLSVFANTFLSQLGNRVMSGLFETKPSTSGVTLTPLGNPNAGSTVGVSSQVAALLTQTVSVRDAGLYDILSQFVACPSESGSINRQSDECVIDTDFEQAVRSAEADAPLTIKQAMEKNLLRGSWRLISSLDAGLNTSVDCRNQAYCHANIAKLRLARVVPLGFEIAAALSPIGRPWTLGEVTAGFNNCNEQGARDERNPFCHLIDPNWVLKAPLTRCKAEVPGPMLATQDTNIRHSICVDKPTCLQDNGGGSCESPWGYCVREKNIWRLNGDSCPAQFSTCATYTGVSPGAQRSVSYLSRTVDFATCTEQDVGCRGYATTQMRNADAQGKYAWNESPKAYFNGKAAACTQPGCTQFIRQDGASAYLKKAPKYLGCYDANPLTEGIIEWPEKLADLTKLKPRDECKDYAPVCVKDEVGCTRYTPENGDPAIPAIAGNGDTCAQECVGYNTYKQMPAAFERAKFPLYFIPESANQCSGAEVGCDQFVNVERGERAEYYSFVRQCEKPAPNNTNSAVFYAWEGSDAQGYQLRSYVLKRGPKMYPQEDPTDVTPAYAAAYDAARIRSYGELCGKDLYAQRLADPDCRELFDRAGNAYYRLLSKTITVSDECAVMRKTDADVYYASREIIANQAACAEAKGAWSQNQGCQICEGGGELRGGVCLYAMMESEAISCRAEASGCRAYTGNAGNNVRVAYQAKFDDLDTTGWSGGTLSAESVVVGGKSLRVDDRNVSLSISSTPVAGSSYLMNFWAKGQGTLTVTFDGTDAEPSNRATFRLTGDWHQFSLGPVYIKSVEAGAAITFAVNENVPLFLDNIVIRETIDTVNVVKNSWKTPASCDANTQDNIPGEALGCQLYRDHNNAPVSLKSFTRICRDEAVGCEKLTDTYNTPELEGKTYLVRCSARFGDTVDPESRACTTKLDGDGDGQPDNKQVCTLPLGEDYCAFTVNRVFSVVAMEDDDRLAYVIAVPADDIAYLVNRQEFRCDVKEKGCMVLGEMKGAGAGRTPTAMNKLVDAEKYDQLLCTGDAEGCEAYSSNVGGADRTVYFKDPSVTGRPLCEYRENVDGNSGWFVKGTDNECYDDYRVTGNLFGVKSQGDPGYIGKVGLCSEQYNACKELRDPADTSQVYPEGQPYYVLDNAKIDRSSCNGQASLQEGCVLFNDTSVPTKPWNSIKTYGLSSSKNGGLVAPASALLTDRGTVDCDAEGCYSPEQQNAAAKCRDGYKLETIHFRDGQGNIVRTVYGCVVPKNDTNTVLKVTRDRACAEWLACRSAMTVLDKTKNQPKVVCNSVDLCGAYGADGQCANWITAPEQKGQKLTKELYSQRGTGWYDKEYAGYSLYDKYQVWDYRFLQTKSGEIKLAAVPFAFDAAKTACERHDDGADCTVQGTNGKCFGGVCAVAFDGGVNVAGPACRGYPDQESPFTFNEAEIDWERVEAGRPSYNGYSEEQRKDRINMTALNRGFKTQLTGFDSANICQLGDRCQCSYKQNDYGQGEMTRYYDVKHKNTPVGLCRGGYAVMSGNAVDKMGWSCATSRDCRDDRFAGDAPIQGFEEQLELRDRRDGECITRTKTSFHRGWIGYCLEPDNSIITPGSGVGGQGCLTWMPLDTVPGDMSLDNQYAEAGYIVDPARVAAAYCLQSVGNAFQMVGGKCKDYSVSGRVDIRDGRPDFSIESQCTEQFPEGAYSYQGEALVMSAIADNTTDSVTTQRLNIPDAAQFTVSDLNYIELDFRGADGEGPQSGKAHIVNGGARSSQEPFVWKPRIYSSSDAGCQSVAASVGVREYECVTGEVTGQNGIASVTKDNDGKTYFSFVYSDNVAASLIYPRVSDNGGLLASEPAGSYSENNSGDGGWIVFIFDSNGHLVNNGAHTVVVNRNKSVAATMVALVSRVVKHEICKEAVTVADEEGTGNAAWTDRLWTRGGDKQPSKDFVPNRGTVRKTWDNKPYGGILVVLDQLSTTPLYHYVRNVTRYITWRAGYKYACDGGKCGNEAINDNTPWPRASTQDGFSILKQLFGKVYQKYTIKDNRSGYNESVSCDEQNSCDSRSEANVGASPPKVGSIDTANCTVVPGGMAASGACKMKRINQFTIDDADEGIIFGSGGRQAILRFFAWADNDRMPIGNIVIEWDNSDKIQGGNSPGKYKNRKPACQDADVIPVKTCAADRNKVCFSDADCGGGAETCNDLYTLFGNSPDACQPGYYEFTGGYAFDKDDTGQNGKCGYTIGGRTPQGMTAAELRQLTDTYGLEPGHRYCAFRPRVIVIDNWGWCNGSCNGENGGCWESEDDEDLANFGRCTQPNHRDYSTKVGTPFNGWVIVAEQK